ncbi:hypothetical protein CFAEC_05160 [Corynebacterium faecale]|uniref:DUF6270 domain-containing protein n=1 Tax=Corynebacterium faecale TaxID=1758466 RepID=UPI0025B4666C|nr:DUF6270 domain-containing protein [Corynebacterium faecale]WJY91876.1 hypothetical protein CFAEC_05160 [Corynebacterium faecale]
MPTNLFIYGSCVSRDIVRVTQNRFRVSQYVARQTFASSFAPPLPMPEDLPGLDHNFDKRSVMGDISSNLGSAVRRWAPDSDAIIIDIATEHWGVVPIEGTTYLTHSSELKKSGYLNTIRHGTRIEMGTPRHFRLFEIGARKLQRQLSKLGIIESTLVLKTPFATHTTLGKEVPLSKGRKASEWEDIQAPYYELLNSLGFAVTPSPPSELVLSSDSHRWGPALYHFVDDLYFWWADHIDEFVVGTKQSKEL